MNEQVILYLISVAPNFAELVTNIGTIALLIAAIVVVVSYITKLELDPKRNAETLASLSAVIKHGVRTIPISLVLIVVFGSLVPTQGQLAMIAAYPALKQGTKTVVESVTAVKLKKMATIYLDNTLENLMNEQDR